MTWPDALDVLGALLLLLGSLLSLVAAIGVLRFPDLLTRMHAATKPQVLGLMLVAAGLTLELRDARVAALLGLVVMAQMVTAPVAGHMLGRASYRAGQVDRDLLVVDDLTGVVERVDEERGAP
ncbi:monovalent cation/H(+) antiporter subunit G [Nocardioides aequoreus]|uniref:monovalent cation/H(+) antiporter subunit G n=1 Tax=Nocardioides aequoreus TaxID=397278 RepID=UPI0004C478B3|nr:monovalent cation/H(+) antiporter subunit G [Nocardioides aequoreus]